MKIFPGDSGLALVAGLVLGLMDGCSSAPKLPPADQIKEAWTQYHVGEFDIALRDFKEVENSQPAGSDYHVQAIYGQASIWNDRRDARDPDKATALYRAAIKDAPANPLAAWCALDIVRVQHLAPAEQPLDYAKLAHDYGEVYKQYPDSPAGEQAFMYGANILINAAPKAQLPGVLKEMQDFMQAHPKTIYIGILYGLMAGCCDRLGQEPERLDYMIKALSDTQAGAQTGTDPTSSFASSYWAIAYAAEFEVGDFPVAREYYQRLLKEYPTDVRGFAAKKALVRMDNVEATLRAGKPLPRELAGGVPQ